MELLALFFPALITTLNMDGMKFDMPLNDKDEEKYLELYYMRGDEKAKEILILRNLRLVANVAKKYVNRKYDKEDLISIGTVGLIKGINTFDSKKANKLSTYVSRCIENEILMHLRKNKKSIDEVSLNDLVASDKNGNDLEVIDTIKDEKMPIFDMVSTKININIIRERFEEVLKADEAYIIKSRYGLFGYEKITQEEISKKLGISRSYVSRIEKAALNKLREIVE